MSTIEERLDYLESLLIQDKTKDAEIFDWVVTIDAPNKLLEITWTEQHFHLDDIISLEVTDSKGNSHGGGYRKGTMGLNYVERTSNYKNWASGDAVLQWKLNGVNMAGQVVTIP